jgi:hypothetical protein
MKVSQEYGTKGAFISDNRRPDMQSIGYAMDFFFDFRGTELGIE